jgi:hypothetical protein
VIIGVQSASSMTEACLRGVLKFHLVLWTNWACVPNYVYYLCTGWPILPNYVAIDDIIGEVIAIIGAVQNQLHSGRISPPLG